MRIFAFFIISFVCLTTSLPNKRAFYIPGFMSSGDDTPKSKTEVVIEERTEAGRMILLICTKTCAKHRSEIPLWLKEYNNLKNYQGEEVISYYYHTYRQPISFVNETETNSFPNLIYFIANNRVVFNGDVSRKEAVVSWLTNLDNLRLLSPTTYDGLNDILSSTSNCTNKYLLLADQKQCSQDAWPNVARIAQDMGVKPVRLHFPLDKLSHVLFFKRLPLLSESSCHLTVLLYENSYTEFGDEITPYIIGEWISMLLPVEDGACPVLYENYWQPIEDELTELQQIYFSAELEIEERNRRPIFMFIGATGGVAVIVLAYSIFWGLNGSAFAK